MKKEDFYLNLLLKILKNEKRKFYNFRKDNSTFLYFTCQQTNFIQRTHTNKIHQIHPLNGSTFFKTKDPHVSKIQKLSNLSAFRFTILTRNSSTRFHDIQISFLIPPVVTAMAKMAAPRIRQRGERAEKVESLIYMRFRGRPHGFTTEKPKKEYRIYSFPCREPISIQLFRST